MKKIRLHFGAKNAPAIRDMAAATLEDGGFVTARDGLPTVGGKMPDGSVYAGLSPDTGKPMYTLASHESLSTTWTQATKYAQKLKAHGHKDWRLPTPRELEALFNNRAAIGLEVRSSGVLGFYWSNTKDTNVNLRVMLEGAITADSFATVRGVHASIRCIRND